MRHEVVNIPTGWAGTNATVAKVKEVVDASLQDPKVVLQAQHLVRHLPERDKTAEIRAVTSFVRRKVRYTNEGIETLKTPRVLLDEIDHYGKAVGDCDDHVILWMALHRALGNPTRIKVVSQRPDKLAGHIFGEVYNSNTKRWVTDDTIVKNKPVGWSHPKGKFTRVKTYSGTSGLNGLEGGLGMQNSWIPKRRGYLMSAQDTVPAGWRVKNSRGPAITVDESEGLGFEIPGELISIATALTPKARAMYTRYKKKRRKKKASPLPLPDLSFPSATKAVKCPPGYRPVQVDGWAEDALGALGQGGFA